jgi:cytochrome d ubiquinol oxidase subunit II
MHPELILISIAVCAAAMYAIFGGADFGVGVWEFNLALRTTPDEKKLMYRAIGPVWEANHVWLIFLLMIFWSAFPIAFAAVCRLAFIPLLLALVGIVFRGAAYAFRHHLDQNAKRWWEAVFALASVAAPFFLGCTVGTIATAQPEINADGSFIGNQLNAWISVPSAFFGFFAVGICAYLAAVFLSREAFLKSELELAETWRKRAFFVGLIVGLFSIAGLVIAYHWMPEIWMGIVQRSWPAVAVSVASGIATLVFLAMRKFWLASFSAPVAVAAILTGWVIAQYPHLIIDAIDIGTHQVPANVMWLLIFCIAMGLAVILPPMIWLFRIFKSS